MVSNNACHAFGNARIGSGVTSIYDYENAVEDDVTQSFEYLTIKDMQ